MCGESRTHGGNGGDGETGRKVPRSVPTHSYKLDRLTRSVADLDKLSKLFERHGVALVSLQESLDATTATGRLMMNLLASVSQWEREVIGERTSDALQHLKAQGKRYCHTVYDNAEVIALMHQLRTDGHSYEAIAQHLNHAGIPTARGNPWQAGPAGAFEQKYTVSI